MPTMRPFLLLTLVAFGLSTTAGAATYTGTMLGMYEVPSTGSPAMGFTTLTIVDDSMTVSVNWSGLTGGPASMAHVHCCTAPGTNTSVAVGYSGFPAATSGTYTATFNLLDSSIYTSAFLAASGGTATAARDALIAGLNGGLAYSNIHDATFPGGEIRANLTLVPEPSSLLLVAAGLLGAGYIRRKRA